MNRTGTEVFGSMIADKTANYPFDLARLVAAQLEQVLGRPFDEGVLAQFFEMLYFASLRTEEGWQPLFTVNFVEATEPHGGDAPESIANGWSGVSFGAAMPMDIRTLTKLARAVDPEVASMNVYADSNRQLFIWGLVDQELRHGDRIVSAIGSESLRPGLFQATVAGPGSICVSRNGTLLGNLLQDVLVEQHFDVLWSGPVHAQIAWYMREFVERNYQQLSADCGSPHPMLLERELLLRWVNSLSRVLVNIQQYRHGGGLVIVPRPELDSSNVNYRIRYDRLSRAVVALVRASLLRDKGISTLMQVVQNPIPPGLYEDIQDLRKLATEVELRKDEVLGSLRFIASLSCVDGVVLLDKSMGVHGFGVELRTDSDLDHAFLAGDAEATHAQLRRVEITQFGTRHRAMMRYCYQCPGSLGFAISRDGGIQAMMRIDGHLILWENIAVALAMTAQGFSPEDPMQSLVLRRFGVRPFR